MIADIAGKLTNQTGARMKMTWLVVAFTTAVLVYLYPDQGGVLLSKLNRVALGAVLGVALDRHIFWYARPSATDPNPQWMLRRAGVVIGVALAAALAV